MEMRNYTFDENILSDLHKDAYGFRPRSEEFWSTWETADNEGKQRIWDQIVDDLGASVREEEKRQQEAIYELESRLRFIMATCSCMREDAIRYLHDAYKTHGDVEYLEFNLGVPYGYLSGKNWG